MVARTIFSETNDDRLSALAALEKSMRKIQKKEAEAKEELIKAIEHLPESFRNFVNDTLVIDSLHQHRIWTRRIHWEQNSVYRFRTRQGVMRNFRALVKAWNNSVMVSFDKDPDRVEVVLTVL